jgi:hypothetical protein
MSRVHALVTIALAGSWLLPGCGGASSEEAEVSPAVDDLLLYCGEARGSLLELDVMTSGQKPVNTSALGFGSSNFQRLADKVSAQAPVNEDIRRWNTAVEAWTQGLRAIPPQIANGRFVEPDTSALDKALLAELTPVSKRLGTWVKGVCDH